jgi:hypothetical protein
MLAIASDTAVCLWQDPFADDGSIRLETVRIGIARDQFGERAVTFFGKAQPLHLLPGRVKVPCQVSGP